MVVAAVAGLLAAAGIGSSAPAGASGPVRGTALTAGAGMMAEAAVAIDPRRRTHLAAAADPYLNPPRVLAALSVDGGHRWSKPVEVRPPGYVKSYDPQVQFAPDGDLVVVAGASRAGAPGCHPGSVVFAAHVHGRAVTYRMLAAAGPSEFVDRPVTLPRPGGLLVTYTASAGPGAQCRATPLRSRIWLQRLDWALGLQVRTPVPAATGRVYGSSLAVFGAGRLAIATMATRPAGRVAVSVAVGGADSGGLRLAATVPAGAAVPITVPPLGGVVTAMPVVAGAAGSPLVLAWSQRAGRRVHTVVARSSDGRHFTMLAPPPAGGVAQLVPTLVVSVVGETMLTEADVVSAAQVRFPVWRLTGRRWSPLGSAGRGTAGYAELGEALGVAAAAGQVAVAVPVQRSRTSTLAVTVHALPQTAANARPSVGADRPQASSTPRGKPPAARLWWWALPVTVVGAWALRAAQVRRRRRRRGG